MNKSHNKGFSLIELIIVIAIMAVLVAIIAPNLTKYLAQSKERTDTMNAESIKKVIEQACALTNTEVSMPGTVGSWVEFKEGSAYYDSTAADQGGYMAFSKYVATEFASVPVVKKTGNHFWVKITANPDGSYKVEVEAR